MSKQEKSNKLNLNKSLSAEEHTLARLGYQELVVLSTRELN